MTDVLIAGGGIAGSALAILLGRGGVSVELFERSDFPREKPCGEGIMPAGAGMLERLGLSQAVGGAPFHGVRYHFAGRVAEGLFPSDSSRPARGFGQRRRHLDRVLFEAAAATRGVTARTRSHVESPLVEEGRVVGLRVDGQPRRGRLVVAADGARSRIRASLGLDLPVKLPRLGLRRHFRLHSAQPQPDRVEVFFRPGREIYVAPLPDREILVAALAPASSLREEPALQFERWCREEPVLAARLEGASPSSSLTGAFPLGARARAGIAPGVVLLGDAAGFLDPITGGGISQALLTAELLAERFVHRLGSDESWLRQFDRDRRRLLRDYRLVTQAVLWLSQHPVLAQRALGLLAHTPSLLSHFVSVSAGTRSLLPRWPPARPSRTSRAASLRFAEGVLRYASRRIENRPIEKVPRA